MKRRKAAKEKRETEQIITPRETTCQPAVGRLQLARDSPFIEGSLKRAAAHRQGASPTKTPCLGPQLQPNIGCNGATSGHVDHPRTPTSAKINPIAAPPIAHRIASSTAAIHSVNHQPPLPTRTNDDATTHIFRFLNSNVVLFPESRFSVLVPVPDCHFRRN